MRSTHPRDAQDIQGSQGIQEDIRDTQHARATQRLRDARGPQRIQDASLIFKCPEVGSYFLLSGASSKMMSLSSFIFPLFVSTSLARPDVDRNFARVDLPETSRSGPHPEGSENGPNGSGALRDRRRLRNDRSVNRNSHRIGPPPKSENLASPRRILERRNVAVAHTP